MKKDTHESSYNVSLIDSSPGGKSLKNTYNHIKSSHYGQSYNWKKIHKERSRRESTNNFMSRTRASIPMENKDLIEAIKLISQLQKRNETLQLELRKREEEVSEIAGYYESIHLEKEGHIKSLKKEIQDQQEREPIRFFEYVSCIKVENQRLGSKVTELEGLLELKQNELHSIQRFQDQKNNLELKLRVMDEAMKCSAMVHKEQIDDLERQHTSLISSMQRKMDGLLGDVKSKAQSDAFSKLDHLMKSSPELIDKLVHELECQVRNVDKSYQKLQKRSDDRDNLIDAVETYERNEKEYIKQKKDLLKEKAQLETNVSALTRELNCLREQFKDDESKLRKTLKDQQEDTSYEVNHVKSLLIEKETELEDLKYKAEAVLSQRTVAEVFIVDYIMRVKEQKRKDSQGKCHKDSNLTPADLNDISLNEREKVLREILVSMNKHIK